MSDLNKCVFSGRLTRDAIVRQTANGTPVADMTICSNRIFGRDESGNRKEEATFIDVTLFGKSAEALSSYLTKGQYVMVEGRLKLDSWQTNEGVKRTKLSIIADDINFPPKNNSTGKPSSAAFSEEEEELQEQNAPF